MEDLEKKIVQRLDRVINQLEVLAERMGSRSPVIERLDRIEAARQAKQFADLLND